MPGLAVLDDREYLLAFQAIDGVFQRFPPCKLGIFNHLILLCALQLELCFIKIANSHLISFGSVIMGVWFGSLFVLILAVYLAHQERYRRGNDSVRMDLLAVALTFYLAGHITTIAFNVPLNDHIQALDLQQLSKEQLSKERDNFEDTWNFWNVFRVVTEFVTCCCLLVTLMWLDRKRCFFKSDNDKKE